MPQLDYRSKNKIQMFQLAKKNPHAQARLHHGTKPIPGMAKGPWTGQEATRPKPNVHSLWPGAQMDQRNTFTNTNPPARLCGALLLCLLNVLSQSCLLPMKLLIMLLLERAGLLLKPCNLPAEALCA